MPFDGLRVLSLESRRAVEMERLIQKQAGEAFVAPSMREIPLEENHAALDFAQHLIAGEFDIVIFLTGVGTRLLGQIAETRVPQTDFAAALRQTPVIARGPKPMAVLREWSVPAQLVPEPNTWREIMGVLASIDLVHKRVAIQEYGRPSEDLNQALRNAGATITQVPVYQWDLPADLAPLQNAARKLAAGEIDVLLLTSSVQVENLLSVAGELELETAVKAALRRVVIASIGPTTSETLRELGVTVDFEPSHPKMGILVNEIAQHAQQLHREKNQKK